MIKQQRRPRVGQHYFKVIVPAAFLVVIMALIMGPISLTKSASGPEIVSPPTRSALLAANGPSVLPVSRGSIASSGLNFAGPMVFSETVALYAADCTTPKSAFNLGETVCAKTDGIDLTTPGNYYMNWVDSQLNQTNGGTINQNPQYFLFVPPTTGTWKATVGRVNPADSSIIGNPPIFTVSTGPAISTYASNCVTPQTTFTLGDTVCAKVSGVDPSFNRRFAWVDPAGNVRSTTTITTDPQTNTFILPTAQIDPTYQIDNRGTWKANVISSRGSAVLTAGFQVQATTPSADLSIGKGLEGGQPTSGNDATFSVSVYNRGPNDAQNVVVTDATPANTTFQSVTPGSGFSCTGTATVTCTGSILKAGDTALFMFVYTAGAAGSTITNTASVTSSTQELNTADNSATAGPYTIGTGGGGTGTCTLDCPEDIVTAANTTDNNNNPGANVHFDQATTTGTCGTVTADHCDDCFFPVGTTRVTFTASTGDSCSFAVTVTSPSNAPTITCPPNKEVDAMGACQVQVDAGTATATGGQNVTIFATRSDGKPMYNCDSNGQNCVRQSPDYPFGGGVTTITWTATSHDASGAETGNSSCTQTITVDNASDDTTAPVISCPANKTVGTDPGACSATVNPGTATATDNCDSAPAITGTRSDNEPLSAPYPKGTTTITWTATDASGNSSSCSQTVTVNDTEAPTITCPANITTGNDPGSCSATVNPGTATATDNCGSPTVTGTRSDNQSLSSPYPKGTTTITWTATDGSGNSSSCTQTVTVNDTEPPTISCPANITKNNDPGVCGAVVTYTTPVGSDNCPGATTAQKAGLPSGSTFPVGTTTNTFEVTDSSGNKTSCSFTVTVNDVEPPVITCPSSQTLEPTCPSGAIANWTPPVGTDNCPGAVTTETAGPAPGSVFPIGTTTVTYTVNDAHGNSTSCSFTVTVKTVLQTLDDLRASVAANTQLNGTQRNGLLAKLDAAKQLIQSGNQNGACAKLSDFVNSTQNFIDHGDLSATTGNAWISTANHIRNAIGCTNNPCT